MEISESALHFKHAGQCRKKKKKRRFCDVIALSSVEDARRTRRISAKYVTLLRSTVSKRLKEKEMQFARSCEPFRRHSSPFRVERGSCLIKLRGGPIIKNLSPRWPCIYNGTKRKKIHRERPRPSYIIDGLPFSRSTFSSHLASSTDLQLPLPSLQPPPSTTHDSSPLSINI